MKKHIITKEQVDQDYNYIGSVNLLDFHIVELAKDLDCKIIFNQSNTCRCLLATLKTTIIVNGDLNIRGGIDVGNIIVNGNINYVGEGAGGDITAYSVTANNIESPVTKKLGFIIECEGILNVAGNVNCRILKANTPNIGGNVICEEEGNFGFGGLDVKGNAKFKYLFSKAMINVGGDLVCEKGITAFSSITAGTITASVIFAGVNPENFVELNNTKHFIAKDTISAKILSGKICHGNLIN